MLRRASVWAAIFLFGLSATARADFVVTIGSTSIPQNGAGFVDVLIRSTNPRGNDPLALFGFDFLITPTSPRQLSFLNPQLDAQLLLSTYVFFSNSVDAHDATAVGTVSSVSAGTNNQFVGGDETQDTNNVVVSTDRLLARLNLTAATGLPPPIPGDTFQINLTGPIGLTFFRDAALTIIPYTSTTGTITITGAAPSTPEPSGLVLLSLGISMALVARRFSRPRAA